MSIRITLVLTGLLILLGGCKAQNQSASSQQNLPDYYTLGAQSRDGIGKYYMGREISHVMGHLGASWLERPEREAEEKNFLTG